MAVAGQKLPGEASISALSYLQLAARPTYFSGLPCMMSQRYNTLKRRIFLCHFEVWSRSYWLGGHRIRKYTLHCNHVSELQVEFFMENSTLVYGCVRFIVSLSNACSCGWCRQRYPDKSHSDENKLRQKLHVNTYVVTYVHCTKSTYDQT